VASVTPGGAVGVAVGAGVGVAVVGDGLGVGDVLGVEDVIGGGEVLGGGEAPQVTPLTEKLAGPLLLPVNAPLNPMFVLAPVASAPFQLSLVTVTFSPDWDQVPSQPLVTCWPPGNVNASVQLVIAGPVLVIVTLPVNPPGQLLGTEYATPHPPALAASRSGSRGDSSAAASAARANSAVAATGSGETARVYRRWGDAGPVMVDSSGLAGDGAIVSSRRSPAPPCVTGRRPSLSASLLVRASWPGLEGAQFEHRR
jgi:hypothetical protein